MWPQASPKGRSEAEHVAARSRSESHKEALLTSSDSSINGVLITNPDGRKPNRIGTAAIPGISATSGSSEPDLLADTLLHPEHIAGTSALSTSGKREGPTSGPWDRSRGDAAILPSSQEPSIREAQKAILCTF